MSRSFRCLIALELGGNYGHLVRQLSLAKALRTLGHAVRFVVPDLRTASQLLGKEGFSFLQSPVRKPCFELNSFAICSYSEILLRSGWADSASFQGSMEAWLNLLRLCCPDLLIADHAPTALLAAHVLGLPSAAVGTGFEIPPRESPLPLIPCRSESDKMRREGLDAEVVKRMSACLPAELRWRFSTVSNIFDQSKIILSTFPEIDHYGARRDCDYSGVFYEFSGGVRASWPDGDGLRVVLYLRGSSEGIVQTLEAIRENSCRCLCFIPDAEHWLVERFQSEKIRISRIAFDLNDLLASADFAIGYGSMGFTAKVLLAGVPQIILPCYVEQAICAKRVAELGAGVFMLNPGAVNLKEYSDAIGQVSEEGAMKVAAKKFSNKYKDYRSDEECFKVALSLIEYCNA